MNWINIPYFIFHFIFVAELCIVLLLPDLMVWIGWGQTSPQTGKNDFSPGKSKGYQALWFFFIYPLFDNIIFEGWFVIKFLWTCLWWRFPFVTRFSYYICAACVTKQWLIFNILRPIFQKDENMNSSNRNAQFCVCHNILLFQANGHDIFHDILFSLYKQISRK